MDLINQRSDVFWGCLNRDAIAEVEYKRSGAERIHNAGCLNGKMGAADDKELWVEVSLDASHLALLDVPHRPGNRNRFVQTDCVHASRRGIAFIMQTSAARETNDRNRGVPLAQSIHDHAYRLSAPTVEVWLR
jgi:hypothetical protein